MPSADWENKTISNLPGQDIVVGLPFEPKFDGSQIGVADKSGASTGMRMYMPSTGTDQTYDKKWISVEASEERLRVDGLNGNWKRDNKVRNALGVGLPVPNDAIKLQVTMEMPT